MKKQAVKPGSRCSTYVLNLKVEQVQFFLLKFRCREAILSRAQSRNIPNFDQKNGDIGRAQSKRTDLW